MKEINGKYIQTFSQILIYFTPSENTIKNLLIKVKHNKYNFVLLLKCINTYLQTKDINKVLKLTNFYTFKQILLCGVLVTTVFYLKVYATNKFYNSIPP